MPRPNPTLAEWIRNASDETLIHRYREDSAEQERLVSENRPNPTRYMIGVAEGIVSYSDLVTLLSAEIERRKIVLD